LSDIFFFFFPFFSFLSFSFPRLLLYPFDRAPSQPILSLSVGSDGGWAALSLSGAGGRLLSGGAGRRAVGSHGVGRGPSSRGFSSGRGGHSAAGAPPAPPLLLSFFPNVGAPPPRGSGTPPSAWRGCWGQIQTTAVAAAADLAEWASSGRWAKLARAARRRSSPPRAAPASTHPDAAPTSSPPQHLSLTASRRARLQLAAPAAAAAELHPPSALSLLRPPSSFSLRWPPAQDSACPLSRHR
jgi:hypothetical protein